MDLKVNVKVNVNRRIVVNGKEYGSVEELPEGMRQAYGNAVASARLGSGGPGVSRTVTINGREYAGPGEMEPDVRAIYEKALENARAAGTPAGPPPPPPRRRRYPRRQIGRASCRERVLRLV